jgi:replicative DNA helicase
MASAEMQLVCKIIKTGDMKRVVEWGITEEDFLSSEPKTIFKILLATYLHPETMGSVIGPQLASEKFTQLNLADVDTSVTMEHLCLEVRNRRLSKEIKEGATRAIEEADINPVAALSHLQMAAATVMRLDAGKMTDVEMSTGLAQVLDDYFRTQRGDLVGKFLWPWEPLQAETGGGQEDDYIVFYGRPKSMKSWVLCYLISFLVDSGKRVLVYTKEMTTKNIYRRIAAFLAGIPYDDLRHARLPPHHEQVLLYWANQAKQWEGQNRLIVLSAKDVSGRDTVSWLRSKVEKYLPDVVFIDGMYLMSPENPKLMKMNEKVESISRAVRDMILQTKTPVIATLQANRKAAQHEKAEFDEIAFSDSVSQDCTMAIRVIKNKFEPTITLAFAGAREVKFAGMSIKAVPCTNFSFNSMLTDQEILKAKSADDSESDDKKKNKREPRTLGKSDAEKTFDKDYTKALSQI